MRRAFTLTSLILGKLADLGEAALDVFFPAKYPEARLWRQLLGLDARHRFNRRTFSALLARLAAQGLAVRRGSCWRITPRGVRRVARQRSGAPLPPDGMGRIVIFDIPERERRKRTAIRLELIAAGFRQLQKSVWYGERPLPEAFPSLVDELRLRGCVHIFGVTKRGTLGLTKSDDRQ